MHSIVIGVDETGVGACAGPLVVAAAAFRIDAPIVTATYASVRKDVLLQACDSKAVKKSEHLQCLAAAIRRAAETTAVIERSVADIDRHLLSNILPETIRLAVSRVMEQLAPRYTLASDYLVLLDGDLEIPPGIPCEVRPIAGGDAKYWQIGAASILAKDVNDAAMLELSRRFPEYSFDTNKGYPTPDHKRRLKELGPCAAHRRTFKPVQASRPVPKGIET